MASILGFDVADYVPDLLKGGLGLFGAYNEYNNQSNASNSLLDAYRQASEQNYQNQVDYAKWQADQANAQRQYSAANAAANRRAAMQNSVNSQKALKRGMKEESKYFNQATGYIKPYQQVGEQLLPQVAQTYGQGLQGTNLLSAYFNSPQMIQAMNQSVPAYNLNIPLPPEYK